MADKERKFIRRVQYRADREAANALIEAYYREIYAFSYRQLGHREHAMDMTQEIFISVLQSINSYDPKKSAFRTWLYRIASNKIVDYFRSAYYQNQQRLVPIDAVVIPQEMGLEEAYIDRVLLEQILEAMAQLPFAQQQILRLKIFGEQTFRDISLTMALPESTVKTRYYAAIQSIRKKVLHL